jgi:hypothetical protein
MTLVTLSAKWTEVTHDRVALRQSFCSFAPHFMGHEAVMSTKGWDTSLASQLNGCSNASWDQNLLEALYCSP